MSKPRSKQSLPRVTTKKSIGRARSQGSKSQLVENPGISSISRATSNLPGRAKNIATSSFSPFVESERDDASSQRVQNRFSRFATDRRVVSGRKPKQARSTTSSSSANGPKSMAIAKRSLQGGNQDRELSLKGWNPQRHYDIRPVIPAQQAELISVARAMNREEFAPRLHKLFNPEREAALEAIESGNYIGWRCPEYDYDCIRVGSSAKCFCGHLLTTHTGIDKQGRRGCQHGTCPCKNFAFIPSRPEDVGEWWLPRRPGFDVTKWRAKCRCKHTHESHDPNSRRQCRVKGCSCFAFDSNFLCCACDRHWEDHETFFDSTDSRRRKGLPYGEHFLPFHELPTLRNIVLTGEEDDNRDYEAIANGPYAIPRANPTQLAKQLMR